MPYKNSKNKSGSVVSLLVLLITSIIFFVLFLNRQSFIDQFYAWQYEPTAQIENFSKQVDFTDNGKFLFYASQPSLESRETFNQRCPNQEHETAVLGCYDNKNIYIYNIENKKLEGIRPVTAAHEMLHVAYARLDDNEKNKLNDLIEKEYNILKNNKQLSKRLEFYARTEPGERLNELHSIFGTEFADLSPELEKHYEKYFHNRNNVISLYKNYSAVFNEIENNSKKLSAELTQLADIIESDRKQYTTQVDLLNTEIQAFNNKANNGQFKSSEEFDAERRQLEAKVVNLQELRESINKKITDYKAIQKQLEAIALESEVLNRSINSNLEPTPTL